MVTPPNHFIARAGFTLGGAPGILKIFAKSSCRIYVKAKKKCYHQSMGPLAMCQMVNPALAIALRSEKG